MAAPDRHAGTFVRRAGSYAIWRGAAPGISGGRPLEYPRNRLWAGVRINFFQIFVAKPVLGCFGEAWHRLGM